MLFRLFSTRHCTTNRTHSNTKMLRQWRSRFARHRNLLSQVFSSTVGCTALLALTFLIPRRKELVVLWGRDGGRYLDNCKHLHAMASQCDRSGRSWTYVAYDAASVEAIVAAGAAAILRGSRQDFWLSLRAGTIFVDADDWAKSWRRGASNRAQVVQLWHGIPLKQVQIARYRSRPRSSPLREFAYGLFCRITGRFVRTDWFVSTAPFVTENAFAQSFNYRNVSHAGYPRTDVFFAPNNALTEINVDASSREAISRFRAANPEGRVGLYAPTFREAAVPGHAPIPTEWLDALSRCATEQSMLVLLKLHPTVSASVDLGGQPGLHLIPSESDVYPLLPSTDFLITDYSSIYFDYLLLDRPILFFAYDLGRYLAVEREMYFDYGKMTPGPVCADIESLVAAIRHTFADDDPWRPERQALRSKLFLHEPGSATQRLIAEVFGSDGTQPTTAAHAAEHR